MRAGKEGERAGEATRAASGDLHGRDGGRDRVIGDRVLQHPRVIRRQNTHELLANHPNCDAGARRSAAVQESA